MADFENNPIINGQRPDNDQLGFGQDLELQVRRNRDNDDPTEIRKKHLEKVRTTAYNVCCKGPNTPQVNIINYKNINYKRRFI